MLGPLEPQAQQMGQLEPLEPAESMGWMGPLGPLGPLALLERKEALGPQAQFPLLVEIGGHIHQTEAPLSTI